MGTTSEKLVYLNETKQKIKESINLTNANIVDEPFRQYAVILKNRLPEIVGDPSIIWNNYEHVTGSGTSITISTYKSIFEYSLNGNTTQSGTPTPDAPIPVKTVTGNQAITISNGTNSTVQYINLDKNLAQHLNGWINTSGVFKTSTDDSFYFPVIEGETYIYNSSGNRSICAIFENIPSNNDTCISDTYNGSFQRNKPFVASATGYMVIYANTPSSQTVINDFIAVKGSTIGEYKPYFEPIELCKIGTYQDRIYKSNGKWYLHKEIGKLVLDGSEDWQLYNASGSQPRRFGLYQSKWYKDSISILSNYFIGDVVASQVDLSIWTQTNYLGITDKNSYWASASDLKTWLSTHNTIVYYVLATATNEEIKDYDLLNDLNSLELMTGNINITVSGDLASPINITAIKN